MYFFKEYIVVSIHELGIGLNDRDAVRQVLGYLPQEFGVYPRISALDLLEHFAVLKGIPTKDRKAVVEALLQRNNL